MVRPIRGWITFKIKDKVNSLPNNKFLDWSELEEIADEIINVPKNLKFVLRWVENIVGKGENAG